MNHNDRKIRDQRGFILAEIAINTLVSSLVVLGVIAIFLPLNLLVQKQRAWLQLTDTATTTTYVLLNELRDGELTHGGAHSFTIIHDDERRLWRVQKTTRKYSDHKAVYGLYLRVNIKPSEEWVAGVRSLNCHYDVYDKRTKKIVRQDAFHPKAQTRLVGVQFDLQLTAEQHLTESWRIYFRKKLHKPDLKKEMQHYKQQKKKIRKTKR